MSILGTADVDVGRLTTAGMDWKSLVYSRSLPSQPVLRTQQQSAAERVKSLVYSRIEPSASSLLEGTSFESQFRSVPSKLQTVL